jgi:hypothetical protein
MQELETSIIGNKQRTKLITLKETKLECIRELEKKIKQHACHQWISCVSGKTPKRKGDYGSPLPPREVS